MRFPSQPHVNAQRLRISGPGGPFVVRVIDISTVSLAKHTLTHTHENIGTSEEREEKKQQKTEPFHKDLSAADKVSI